MSLRPKKRMTPEQEQAFIDSERRWAKAEALAAGAAHILSDSGSMALDSRLDLVPLAIVLRSMGPHAPVLLRYGDVLGEHPIGNFRDRH